jgi:fatty-acyl-CoA synthase
VADCLVVGLPDDRFGQVVTAVVTLHAGATTTPAEIGAELGALARYKHPRRYVLGDAVYRAPNGKADYKAARAAAETALA